MKVLLYGEAAAVGSGAWCYAETLRELGHDVCGFSEWTTLERWKRFLPTRTYRHFMGSDVELLRRRHTRALLEAARREHPDIVIVLKGVNVGPNEVRALAAQGAWVVNVNHDDFFSRYRTNRSRLQHRAVPCYHHLFSTREVNVRELATRNPNIEFFPFAYYPRIHRPVAIPASEAGRWDADVVFVGTYERERASLLEELTARVPARYAIWGGGWERATAHLRRHVRGAGVIGDDMCKALGGAKLALGFLRKANRDDYTQRTFEIPACGGLLLAERTSRHLSFFREGEEAAFFDPRVPAELCAQVKLLLDDGERRERIRAAGTAAVARQRHTYRDRIERLFEVHRAFCAARARAVGA